MANDTEKEIAALKQATREAHETMKDLNHQIREAKHVNEELRSTIQEQTTAKIEAEVKKGLDEYQKTLETAIEAATEAVFKRFDTIRDLLLGEDPKSKKLGKPSVEEMIKHRDNNNIICACCDKPAQTALIVYGKEVPMCLEHYNLYVPKVVTSGQDGEIPKMHL